MSRYLVGKFQISTQEPVTLNDIRRWASSTWKTVFGINVFAMNDGHFLFEMPSKKEAEHVLSGEWIWKKRKIPLEWWKPSTGCWPAEIKRDWVRIRLLRLPLNLWSEKIFKIASDHCGGFIETEEETTLKNHLHCAHIKVWGDGRKVSREISPQTVETSTQFRYGSKIRSPLGQKWKGER